LLPEINNPSLPRILDERLEGSLPWVAKLFQNQTPIGDNLPRKIFPDAESELAASSKVAATAKRYGSAKLYGPEELYSTRVSQETSQNFGVTFSSPRAMRLATLNKNLGNFDPFYFPLSLNGVVEKARRLINNAMEGKGHWKDDEARRNHWIENRFGRIKRVAEEAIGLVEGLPLYSQHYVVKDMPKSEELYGYIGDALEDYGRMGSELCEQEPDFLISQFEQKSKTSLDSDWVGTMLDYAAVLITCRERSKVVNQLVDKMNE
jgi:hypothetical protein